MEKVPKGNTSEYIFFVRTVVREGREEKLTQYQASGLIQVSQQTVSKLVRKHYRGKVYCGPKSGRPEFMTKEEIKEVLLEVAELRTTRNSDNNSKVKIDLLLYAIN